MFWLTNALLLVVAIELALIYVNVKKAQDVHKAVVWSPSKKERKPFLLIPGAEIRDTRKPKFCIETGVVYRKCVVLEASGQFTVKGGDQHGEDQKVFQR